GHVLTRRWSHVRGPPLSAVSLFLFLSRHAHPRHLPSFPTRRSSDLRRRRRRARSPCRPRGRAPRPRSPGPSTTRGSAAGGRGRRSEEHTSELQSRSDLVCRLLLEKKKKRESQCNQCRRLTRSYAPWT